MTLTNHALGLEDFRSEESAARPLDTITPREEAGIFVSLLPFRCVNVQIVASHGTFNFTDLTSLPSKENRWTTGQLTDNPLGG